MAEPNATQLKERIVATIKSDPRLWQEEDRQKGFQDIQVGLPQNANFTGLTYPICFVSNAPNFEDDKPFGGLLSPNTLGVSEHQFRFRILFFVLSEDGQEAEIQLDTLQQQIKEILKSNIQLRDPDNINDPNTALATESFPHTTRSFAVQMEGFDLDGRVITLRVRVQSDLS